MPGWQLPGELELAQVPATPAKARRKQENVSNNKGSIKGKAVRRPDNAAENNVELIYNATYSSEFNPVEILWSFAKRLFSNACVEGASYEN